MTLVLLTFTACAIVEIVRRFRRIEAMVLSGVRPWSCNACMSFWGALLVNVSHLTLSWSWPGAAGVLFMFMGTVGATLVLLTWLDSLTPSDPPPV